MVVSYRNSTSNHNRIAFVKFRLKLYLIEILHQTTTRVVTRPLGGRLYLIEILHQTTTLEQRRSVAPRCILSKFYIKPQLRAHYQKNREVVSYRNSTSNHNKLPIIMIIDGVVSYRNSTSNHNRSAFAPALKPLYLIEILHQTTTSSAVSMTGVRLYLIEILHQTTTAN